jgi:hypothetical protein
VLFLIWGIAVVGLLSFVLIWMMTVEVEFKLILERYKNHAFLILRLFHGWVQLRYNLKVQRDDRELVKFVLLKTDEKVMSSKEPYEIFNQIKQWRRKSRKYAGVFRYLGTKVCIKSFSVLSNVGIEGEAALTALLAGALVTIIHGILDFITNTNEIIHRRVVVTPVYNHSLFKLDVDCIFHIKIGHIIIAGLKAFTQKRGKG